MGNTRFVTSAQNRATRATPAATRPTLINGTAPIVTTGVSTVNASTTITRSAGSFSDDGVVTGMQFVCANVPIGTTVVSVGTTTLTLSAPATGPGSGLTSQSTFYPSPPALVEDTQFPMVNAINRDRSKFYACPAGGANDGSDMILDLDLGSVVTVLGFGACGVYDLAGGAFPSQLSIEYIPSGVYRSTGLTTTPINSIGQGNAVIYPTTFSARYVRFRFGNSALAVNGWRLGKLVLFSAQTDLGFLYSEAREQIVTPRVVQEFGPSRVPFTRWTGPSFELVQMQFRNVRKTTRDTLRQIARTQSTVLLVKPEGTLLEVILDTDTFEAGRHVWDSPDIYTDLELAVREVSG